MRALILILYIQGIYYILTSLVALVNIEFFFRLTQMPSDPFKTHANAILFAGLGSILVAGAIEGSYRSLAVTLGFAISLALCVLDLLYVSSDQASRPFILDAAVEGAIAISLFATLLRQTIRRSL